MNCELVSHIAMPESKFKVKKNQNYQRGLGKVVSGLNRGPRGLSFGRLEDQFMAKFPLKSKYILTSNEILDFHQISWDI